MLTRFAQRKKAPQKNLASFAAISLLMTTGHYLVDKACTTLEEQYKSPPAHKK